MKDKGVIKGVLKWDEVIAKCVKIVKDVNNYCQT